jgi:hypothetical protein
MKSFFLGAWLLLLFWIELHIPLPLLLAQGALFITGLWIFSPLGIERFTTSCAHEQGYCRWLGHHRWIKHFSENSWDKSWDKDHSEADYADWDRFLK